MYLIVEIFDGPVRLKLRKVVALESSWEEWTFGELLQRLLSTELEDFANRSCQRVSLNSINEQQSRASVDIPLDESLKAAVELDFRRISYHLEPGIKG